MAYDSFASYYDNLLQDADYEKRSIYFNNIFNKFCTLSFNEKPILLDLGCGTGSLTLLMSRLDYDVIGVDPSVSMLNEARSKVFDTGENILFLCQYGETLDLFGTVDFCLSSLDTINHIEGAVNLGKTFDKVSLFMNPGGIFAFDINTLYKHKNILGNNTFVFDTDDVYCVWQNSINEDNSVDIALDFFEPNEDGSYERYSEDFTEYAYSFDEISSLLDKSGFEVISVFNDLSFDAPDNTCERAVFVARKR